MVGAASTLEDSKSLISLAFFAGQTYFFKADLFWKFDDDNVIADVHHTQPTSAFWLGC